jgi:tetratricopeptide (TPR) repeat protein
MKRLTLVLALFFSLAAALTVSAQGAQPAPQPTPQPPIILADDLFARAGAALEARNYDAAIRDYTLLIFLNPTFSQGYYGRALSYFSQNALDRALSDLARALETAPNSIQYVQGIFALRADIYTQQGDLDSAIADYDSIIALNPDASSYASRGLLRLNQDEFEAALSDMDEAIALAENEAVLYFYRAFIRSRMMDDTEAASDLLRFVALNRTELTQNDPITPGEVKVVALSQGRVHIIPFQASEGQTLSAVAGGEQGSTTDPLLILLAPDGTPIIADDDSGGGTTALLTDIPLTETGLYVLVVSHSLGGFDGAVGVRIELTG